MSENTIIRYEVIFEQLLHKILKISNQFISSHDSGHYCFALARGWMKITHHLSWSPHRLHVGAHRVRETSCVSCGPCEVNGLGRGLIERQWLYLLSPPARLRWVCDAITHTGPSLSHSSIYGRAVICVCSEISVVYEMCVHASCSNSASEFCVCLYQT